VEIISGSEKIHRVWDLNEHLEHAPTKLVTCVRFPLGSYTDDLKDGICGLSSLVLSGDGRVQGSSSPAVLPLTCYQCSANREISRVTHGAMNWRLALQTTPDTSERSIESEHKRNWIELYCAHTKSRTLAVVQDRATKLVLLIIIIFLVCWLPNLISNFVYTAQSLKLIRKLIGLSDIAELF